MEDARYRTREFITVASSVDLTGGSAGDTVLTHRVMHKKVEVCLLGCHFATAVEGPVAADDEAVLSLYKDPTGGGSVVEVSTADTRLSVPAAGVATQSDIVIDTNTATEPGTVNARPTFVRGDLILVKLYSDGNTTAQAGFPWICLREVKTGSQEGPS